MTPEEIARGKKFIDEHRRVPQVQDNARRVKQWLWDNRDDLFSAAEEAMRLRAAIKDHRSQKADDRCWLDDQKLYAALRDGDLGDNTTCDPNAMLANCVRFIQCRTQGGEWKSYQELEEEIAALKAELAAEQFIDDMEGG